MRFASRNKDLLPLAFYNIKADLSEPPNPPLHPGTKEPIKPEDLEPIFPLTFIRQEGETAREVPIPGPVLEAYAVFRPTPLVEATALEKELDTPARIFYKYEGVGPVGSHKTNTALMQAYLAAEDGVGTLATETGAGQWGSALAYAGSRFGIETRVFMVRSSFRQKPGRRVIMEMFGGSVLESPSPTTDAGRRFYDQDKDHPGSLGIAISEAVEVTLRDPGVKYSLGSVLDSVLMHQTVIGLEAEKQMEEMGAVPDTVVGCVGGGSNFAGLAFTFIRHVLAGRRGTRFIAVEPEACPTLTRGALRYDFGDSVGLTPLLYMFTLGMDFIPPPLHAGGLRYHGMAPLVSHLAAAGLVEPRAVDEKTAFDRAALFMRTEGILPAPESAHAVAIAVDEALAAKREGKPRSILFNLSGHGFLDISAYARNGRAGAG
ncbi:MAG: TrpB-like pyridoxal phosphate-dependent enzyme [Candidatus Aminicenantes bacterium]|nr:TrpB-like pyridoxal phosphate-dependent enzyme [Candidatus Aminicenantes bacterium]